MSVRAGHEWYCGPPGSYTDTHLRKLVGLWIACPGCSRDAFAAGNCHTVKIIDEFRAKFPELDAPKFVSMATKTVEGKGGLRDVLVTHDAVFAGCKPPRGAPTSRDLGISLPASVFGNPELQKRLDEGKARGQAKKVQKRREAERGAGACATRKRDLPDRSPDEAEALRRACFEKAWAQKRARENPAPRPQPAAPAAPAAAASQKTKTTELARVAAVTAALNSYGSDSDD